MKLVLKDIKHLCHGKNFQPLAKVAEFNIAITNEISCDTFNGKRKDKTIHTY